MCTSTQTLVFIDTAARRPTAIPADYRATLERFEAGAPGD
jgi:acyl-CoA thioesterase FadM